MLTVDFALLELQPGQRLLDLGCGSGRHTFEAVRRGARVVAADKERAPLHETGFMVAAMEEEGGAGLGSVSRVQADAVRLPFADRAFDHVIASEVLEHIPADQVAIDEMARVLRPGGSLVVTVPRWFPERVCWALSREYHSNPGGHLRIYRGEGLKQLLESAGFAIDSSRHAHSLHAPYWWLRCLLGVNRDRKATQLYHRLLVWRIVSRPVWLDRLERMLDPVLGKSLVLYARKALSGSAELQADEANAA